MKSKRIYLEDENFSTCPTALYKIKDRSDYIGIGVKKNHPTPDSTQPRCQKKISSDRELIEKNFYSEKTKEKQEDKFCISLNSHYSFQVKNFINSALNSKSYSYRAGVSLSRSKISNCSSSSSYYEEDDVEVEFCKNDVSAFDMFLVKEVKPKVQRKFPQFFPSLRSPNSFKKFGLRLNMDTSKEELSPSNLTHRFLPLKLKDDESYKLKLFKFLRKPEHPKLKTETCKSFPLRKFSQLQQEFHPSIGDTFLNKRRKINSQKKIFETEHPFYDNRVISTGEIKYFKIYFDRDVGFSSEWQRPLRTAEMDDDVETDDDQLSSAFRHVMKELADGVKSFVRNKKSVRNYSLIIS